MSFRDAAGFLMVATARNRVRAQWRRLRQPKYLIFTVLGALYLGRLFLHAPTGPNTAATGDFVAAGAAVISVLTMLGAWLFGGDRAALRFSEPEVAFLFTAPVTRRGLVHFRLLRQIVGAGGAAALLALFRARYVANPGFYFAGMWIGLSILALHLTGAALTRASLAEHGVAGWRRRILTLVVLAAVLGACVWFAATDVPPLPEHLDFDSARAWGEGLLDTPPLSWVLIVVTSWVRLAVAADGDAFVHALPAALAVLGAHYAWAVSTSVGFEEAADEAAQRRARLTEQRRGGRRIVRRGKPFVSLAATPGRPWVAITWKNVVASTRVLPLRAILVVTVLVVGGATSAMFAGHAARIGVLETAMWLSAGVAALFAVLGPSLARADLRMDLSHMDLLRSYPLRGRDVVTASIAGPAATLLALQVIALVVATGLSFVAPSVADRGAIDARFGIAVAAASVLAMVTVSGLVVQNALVVYLPGWVAGDGAASRGPEALGRRMLLLALTLIVTALGVVPAVVVGGLVALGLSFVIGASAIAVGGVAGAAVFAALLWPALGALGRGFERFDVSEG
nr:putative ABC exporter domain-containing protein [Kofleriaceae bacterium]